MNCPHCQTPMVPSPQLAGQQVICPQCNGQFTYQPSIAIQPTRKRKPKKSAPKQLMLVATVIWVFLMVAGSIVGFLISAPSGLIEGAGGHYFDPTTYRMVTAEYIIAQRIQGAFVFGFVCPTFIYGIAMTILTVVWFAQKP